MFFNWSSKNWENSDERYKANNSETFSPRNWAKQKLYRWHFKSQSRFKMDMTEARKVKEACADIFCMSLHHRGMVYFHMNLNQLVCHSGQN